MSDTLKSELSLNINWQFSDDDTRMMRLEFPKIPPSISLASLRSAIKDYRDWTAGNQILVGDKEGAPFADSDTAIKYAYIHIASNTYLDLS